LGLSNGKSKAFMVLALIVFKLISKNKPRIFQSKVRLGIVAALISKEKTFNEIKEILDVTDGNLSSHLSKLEEAGYITVQREFVDKKPQSTYRLTDKGIKEFKEYVLLLEGIMDDVGNK
jgi:DNA-binding MarR family transcriptional regulator